MIKGWITWDNRLVMLNTIDHQHLSNIYYYINYTLPEYYPQSVKDEIQGILQKRFKGIILPYKPRPEFKEERIFLLNKGYLLSNNDIVVDGIKLGNY